MTEVAFLGYLEACACVAALAESAFASPAGSGRVEVAILRYRDGHAGLVDASIAALALPSASRGSEECVRGHFELRTCPAGFPVASIAPIRSPASPDTHWQVPRRPRTLGGCSGNPSCIPIWLRSASCGRWKAPPWRNDPAPPRHPPSRSEPARRSGNDTTGLAVATGCSWLGLSNCLCGLVFATWRSATHHAKARAQGREWALASRCPSRISAQKRARFLAIRRSTRPPWDHCQR
jgi:hypothetical protein